MKKVNEVSENGQKMTEKQQKLYEKAKSKLRKVKSLGDAAQFIGNVMKIKNAKNRNKLCRPTRYKTMALSTPCRTPITNWPRVIALVILPIFFK